MCESADCLHANCALAIENHSLLAIQTTGAYCFGMSSNYNSRNRAAEVLVDGDQHRLIRRRENMDDQLMQEMNL